jgi:diadenosine tetraphosphate (Ap4A) HIT family hydrolase
VFGGRRQHQPARLLHRFLAQGLIVRPLDPRLAADCIQLGTLHGSRLLLMNNALVPWFILVPDTPHTEFYELPAAQQSAVLAAVNALSGLLKQRLAAQKTNVAAIGNVVSQLHVHVVGRRADDFCWPGVVWGAQQREAYSQDEAARIAALVCEGLGEAFVPEATQ